MVKSPALCMLGIILYKYKICGTKKTWCQTMENDLTSIYGTLD